MTSANPDKPLYDLELSNDSASLTVRVNASKLDITTAQEFKRAIENIWKPTISRVVIDLSAVEFIDSFGIGALVGVHKRLPPSSSPATLLNPSPSVLTIIEVVRLHRVFNLEHR